MPNRETVETFGFAARLIRPPADREEPGSVYYKTNRMYSVAKAICNPAKGAAGVTKRPNDIARSFLCMMLTATSVEAEPIGVRLPPRLAPKTTDHQSGSVEAVPYA